jgi:Ulp1 family protease
MVCSGNGTIFELDKLVIPLNVMGNHWAVICVFFVEHEIRVYDSLPYTVLKDGG